MKTESRRPALPARSGGEELASALSHGVGAAGAIAGTVFLLLRAAGDPWQVVSVALFGASMILLFLASTLYHALARTRAARVLRILDHASIYLLIAGTYTPFTLVTLRGALGWTLFGIVWGVAVVGIVFKCFFTGRFGRLSVALYVALGWLGVLTVHGLYTEAGLAAVAWLLAGGLAYTGGVVFYAAKRMPYAHAVWHVFVVAGAAAFFVAVYQHVI